MAGWNDPYETFIGSTGQIYSAAVGTAFPTGFATPGAAWTGAGYTSEDGVGLNQSVSYEEFRSWQSPYPIRRKRTGETFSLGAALQQWNETNVTLAFGGGQVNSITGGYEYVPPSAEADLDERAFVIDVVDGASTIRFLMKRASVSEAVESQFQRGAMAVLPVTVNALAPEDGSQLWSFRSNAPGFAPGS